VQQLEAGKTVLQAGKINVFLVNFDEVSASHANSFAAHDATMHKITNKISELTRGNFIAGFTAVHGADHHIQEEEEASTLAAASDFVVFNTAALQQTSNDSSSSNTTTNSTIYMDETLVGAMLVMLIMFALVIAAFSFLADIKTGPHIADLITPEQDTKKSR